MEELEIPEIDFDRYSNRLVIGVPLAVLGIALSILVIWTVAVSPTGVPVQPGIDFTGGTELQIQSDASRATIRSTFDQEVSSIQAIEDPRFANTYIVTFQSTEEQSIAQSAREAGFEVLSTQSTSPSFGSGSQQTAFQGILVAFIGMSLLAFVLFRTFVPSLAIVVSAFSDIVVPVAVMNLVGIELTLGTVAALLMLIGYSVDSDILLTNHVLRRSGGFYESVHRAMETGVTMTVTSMSAMIVMAITATIFGIGLLQSIGLVLAIGLATDLMNTYLFNMGLLRWYKYEGVAR